MRGLSVLAILLFHAFDDFFPLGYLGVDLFFVISGFVVTPLILRIFNDTNNLKKTLLNLLAFYERRFFRLAPALIFILALSSILIFAFYSIDDHPRFARQGIATIFLVGNLGAFRYSGDYFSSNPNPLVHTWSLSVEEQIYLVLPLIFLILIYRRRNKKFYAALILFLLTSLSLIIFLFPIVTQGLYSNLGSNYQNAQFAFYSPLERFWQFGLGGIGYLISVNSQKKWEIHKLISLVLASSLFAILFTQLSPSRQVATLITSILCFTILVFKTFSPLNKRILNTLAWFGDRSYSIYLIHMPIIYLALYSPVFNDLKLSQHLLPAVGIVLSILIGFLVHQKIELRYRYRSFNSFKIGWKFVLLISALVTIVFPTTIFGAMDLGSKNRYWGIDRSLRQPLNPAFVDSNCQRESEDGEPCIYNAKYSRTSTLLIGDSHAGHLSQALIDAGAELNISVTVWAHPNCQLQFKRAVVSTVSDVCLNSNLTTLKWIKLNRPDSIIISQFTQYSSEIENLKLAIIEIKKIVPKILLVANSPIFPDSTLFMVSRPLIMSPYEPPKSFSRRSMVQIHELARQSISIFAKDTGIDVLDLTSSFCGQFSCSRFEKDQWLYRDDDHFSITGAAKAIPFFNTFLTSN